MQHASEFKYLSRRRFRKGISSSDGLRAKNSSDSPMTGRPLDPGSSLIGLGVASLHGFSQYLVSTKWINQAAMAMTIRTSQLGGIAAATGTTKLLHIYQFT
jgi:hypothetical protein